MTDVDWRIFAACKAVDTQAFFPEQGGNNRRARRICRDCNVRAECLEYALIQREPHGIWGGLSSRERARLLDQQGRRKAA